MNTGKLTTTAVSGPRVRGTQPRQEERAARDREDRPARREGASWSGDVDGAASLAAAGISDYGQMPFEAGPAGASGDPSLASLAKLAGGDPAVTRLLSQLEAQGALHRPADSGKPLAEAVADFLSKGGSLKDARLVLEQIADPSRITQMQDRDTCVACQAQFNWAVGSPGEYFRAATALLADGEARVGGLDLRVDQGGPDNRKWIRRHLATEQDRLNATMQTALMNLAYTDRGSYNVENDGLGRRHKRDQQGMSLADTQKFFAGLLGVEVMAFVNEVDAVTMRRLAAAVKDEGRAVVAIRSPAGSDTLLHNVTVTAVAGGNVTYRELDGSLQTVPEKDFLDLLRLDEAAYQQMIGAGSATLATGAAFPPLRAR